MHVFDQLLLHRARIIEMGQKHGIHDIRIFGSVARKEEKPTSDVDLLVSIDSNRSLFDLIEFKQELEELLGHPVDVGTELHPAIHESVAEELVSL